MASLNALEEEIRRMEAEVGSRAESSSSACSLSRSDSDDSELESIPPLPIELLPEFYTTGVSQTASSTPAQAMPPA